MKKVLSLLLCAALLFALALPALAAEPAELSATAEAAWIAKYGNVNLSLTTEEVLAAGYEYGDVVTVRYLEQELALPFCSDYADVDSGAPGLFAREDGTVMLAVRMGSFADVYGLATKTEYEDRSFSWSWNEGIEDPLRVTVSLREAGGYHDEYVLHHFRYTDERSDYPGLSDEEFANFRMVRTTGMGEGVLYRTCSPINPEHKRNTYADAAIRAAGVTVVMNLADEESVARGYEGFDESYYATTDFIALNMGVDVTSDSFRGKLAEGVRFFAGHPGVYAVHCTEGKDRAGFVAAVLECLMGASLEEVRADYARTFYNYYGVTPEDPRYEAVLGSITTQLSTAFGLEDLTNADLAAAAAAYLKGCGVSEETLAALKQNLSAAPAQPEETAEPEEPTPAEAEPAAAAGTTDSVVAGDCLWNLAGRFYGDCTRWSRIAEANALPNPNLILIGQSLLIPA